MNVYVILLVGGGDFDWYVLDETNWNKLEEGSELCEQISEVEHLAEAYSAQKAFSLIRTNGWVVVDAAEGLVY